LRLALAFAASATYIGARKARRSGFLPLAVA
jgi:hypothetical protein